MTRFIRVTSSVADGVTVYTLSEYTGMRSNAEYYRQNNISKVTSNLPLNKLKFDGTAIVAKTVEELATEASLEEKNYYEGLYKANTDGALALRVRQYKEMIDSLPGLGYDAKVTDIQTAIVSDPDLTTEDKLIKGETINGIFESIILNLESIGSATARWDAWRMMEKLIEYLPETPQE